MHRDPILELEHDQPVVHGFAAHDLHVHDVVEPAVGPTTFLPPSHELAVAQEAHRRLDDETDGSERELQIELTDAYLSRELADHRGEVELVGYPVHSVCGCRDSPPRAVCRA